MMNWGLKCYQRKTERQNENQERHKTLLSLVEDSERISNNNINTPSLRRIWA